MEKGTENTRVTLIGIIVEDPEAAIRINGLLHEYGEYIIGRMGIPYHEKQMNIISVVMDAPQEKVSALSGKLGMIPGVRNRPTDGWARSKSRISSRWPATWRRSPMPTRRASASTAGPTADSWP